MSFVAFRTGVLEDIRHAAQRVYPCEGCGLLLGTVVAGRTIVDVATVARNRSAMAHYEFEVDPRDYLYAEHMAQERDLSVVGVWHSHPDRPPMPSAADRASAWAGWSYLIVSIRSSGYGGLRCWRLMDSVGFVEEEVIDA